jgi:hypothetical protein
MEKNLPDLIKDWYSRTSRSSEQTLMVYTQSASHYNPTVHVYSNDDV